MLLMGGAEGVGPLLETARVLDRSDLALQLLVVTGYNEKLYHELIAIPWNKSVRPFGFVKNMWELMRASDLLLTKAGPGTICEGLNAGLPMFLIDALPGQEAGNADYVVSCGAGLLVDSPEALLGALQRLLTSEQDRLEEMKSRAKSIARPHAALDIAQLILQHAGVDT
jgi:1,2-diacylglycerol 3-beta-galactosyltransferase